MTKTKPTSIRFDIEQLEFIKEREKLDSPQKIVNFLLQNYWIQNKLIPEKIIQYAPPKEVYDGDKSIYTQQDEAGLWSTAPKARKPAEIPAEAQTDTKDPIAEIDAKIAAKQAEIDSLGEGQLAKRLRDKYKRDIDTLMARRRSISK